MKNPLPQRQLGATELDVTSIGLGGAVIGDLYREVSEKEAVETILAALSGGIRLIDKSPLYGSGLSEHRIGTALRHWDGDRPVLSTKIGRVADPFAPRDPKSGYVGGLPHHLSFDYSAAGTHRSLEQSLLRLGVDRVDLVMVHDLEPAALGSDYESRFEEAIGGAVPALEDLRRDGIIRGYGIGVNDADAAERFVRAADPDFFLIAGRYSILEQPAMKSLLPLATERGIGVLLGGVYNSGILATGPVEGARYNYGPAPEAILGRVADLERFCKEQEVELRHAALQFVFGHPSVSAVVLGAASAAEVDAQLTDFRTTLPEGFWTKLQQSGLLDEGAPLPKS
ncbi:MAG: aldo/keto reductase [Verrucomicrobiota bacterium]